jgi:hypothetical protein
MYVPKGHFFGDLLNRGIRSIQLTRMRRTSIPFTNLAGNGVSPRICLPQAFDPVRIGGNRQPEIVEQECSTKNKGLQWSQPVGIAEDSVGNLPESIYVSNVMDGQESEILWDGGSQGLYSPSESDERIAKDTTLFLIRVRPPTSRILFGKSRPPNPSLFNCFHLWAQRRVSAH